jgi:hypothetical protein
MSNTEFSDMDQDDVPPLRLDPIDWLGPMLHHLKNVEYVVEHGELSPEGWQTVSRRLTQLAHAADQRAAEPRRWPALVGPGTT